MKEVIRLTQREYEQLEKQVQVTMSHQTSPTEAAYMLGQQSVLAILRKGFTIGTAEPAPPPGGK